MQSETSRRTVLRGAAAAGVVGVAGCLNLGSGDSDAENETALSVPSLELTFFARMENAFNNITDERDELGGSFYAAGNSQEQQVSDLETPISQGVDFILVAPITSEGISPVVQQANDADIPVVTIDRNISEGDIATYVASDNVALGRRSMELCHGFMSDLSDKDEYNVVELQGTQGASTTNDRAKGGSEAIESANDLNLLDSQGAGFSTEEAVSVMEDFITSYGDDIDGVYAHNDLMALGAHQAVDNADVGDIAITGIDGSEAWVDEVQNVDHYGTLAQLPEEMVRQGVDYGLQAVDGDDLDDYYQIEGLEVTSENAGEYLDDYF
ncbi:substrate-binding domain-containing protein [Halostella pelagica]|uniref:substrate-binding domain-containing protein n=1 Tax=Halostella pelagica TaxID=2583824 RepID=UPI00107FE0FC|nr:substrate-binding domain-containing protein [Halostella pelagica]